MYQKVIEKYFNTEFSVRRLLLNWIIIAGIGVGLFCSVFSAVFRLSWAAVLISLSLVVFWGLCLYEAGEREKYHRASVWICASTAVAGFPAIFIAGDGVRNGTYIWFIMGIALTFFLLRGRILYVFLGIELIVYSAVLYFSYLGFFPPVWGLSRGGIYFDVWKNIVTGALGIGFAVRFQIWSYENELKKNKEQNLRMKVLKVEAEKANDAKTDFLANMSHEVRTPMNAIVGLARIALREDMPESVRSNLEDVLTAGNNLLVIINDILDFSKIESGKLEIVRAKYRLSSLIHDVLTVIRFRLSDKPIQFVQEIDHTIPNTLYGDKMRIRQILLNVLGNAVKYTPQGQVSLKIGWKKFGDTAVLLFTVSDTGQGIKEEDLERIFKRFGRVENEENRKIEGTGLGLSIVKNLVDRMEGAISVKSIWGEGSTFTIMLPQKIIEEKNGTEQAQSGEQEAGVQKSRPGEIKFTFPGAKVLVVDDNAMNLKVARGLMKPYGMEVDCAGGGRECLRMVSEKTYDIIFLDHMMPEMDGVETLWRMRENPEFHTVVVALTANAIQGAKKSYLDWGFMDYLSKPMHIGELESCLERYLADFRK